MECKPCIITSTITTEMRKVCEEPAISIAGKLFHSALLSGKKIMNYINTLFLFLSESMLS